MSNHFIVTVPVKFKDNDGQDKNRFQRVGVMFHNRRDDGTDMFNLKLDFPVGATELVIFQPRDKDAPTD